MFLLPGGPNILYDSSLEEQIVRKAGTTLEISTNITGHPKPTSKWFHGDKELIPSGDVSIKKDDTNAILKITKTSGGANSGKYRLLAENSVGSDEAEFDVLIKDKPSPPQNLRIKEVDKNHVIITWEEPKQDGGSPITEYVIEKKDISKASFMNAATADSEKREFKVRYVIEV